MDRYDDELIRFEAEGAAPLPAADRQGHIQHDEFIKREHAEYLAGSIPNAEFILLLGVSPFAPLQRPEQFNSAMLGFLGNILA